jgi:hypothetical protein
VPPREADTVFLLGDWELEPGGEQVRLVCAVVRESGRVSGPVRVIESPNVSPELHELARGVFEHWRDVWGPGR